MEFEGIGLKMGFLEVIFVIQRLWGTSRSYKFVVFRVENHFIIKTKRVNHDSSMRFIRWRR